MSDLPVLVHPLCMTGRSLLALVGLGHGAERSAQEPPRRLDPGDRPLASAPHARQANGERRGGRVPQHQVRAAVVVVELPPFQQPRRLGQRRQQPVPQAAVERLGVSVLLRLAPLDVLVIHVETLPPGLEPTGDPLGPVVAADVPRTTRAGNSSRSVSTTPPEHIRRSTICVRHSRVGHRAAWRGHLHWRDDPRPDRRAAHPGDDRDGLPQGAGLHRPGARAPPPRRE